MLKLMQQVGLECTLSQRQINPNSNSFVGQTRGTANNGNFHGGDANNGSGNNGTANNSLQ
jgi:hypothetical protein